MKSQNGSRKKLLLSIFASIVILLGITLYLYVQEFQRGSDLIVENWVIPEEVSTTTVSSKNTETEEWRTYTNSKYGLEVRFPAELTLKDETVIQDGVYTVFSNNIYEFSVGVNLPGRGSEGALEYTKKAVIVDGVSSTVSLLQWNSETSIDLLSHIYTDTRTFSFRLTCQLTQCSQDEMETIFGQIISTFKSTLPRVQSSDSQATDWKTYVDSDNRFSLQYPAVVTPSIEKTGSVQFKTSSNSTSFTISLQKPTDRWPTLQALINDQYLMSKGMSNPSPSFKTLPSGLTLQDVGVSAIFGHQFVGQLNQGEFIIFSFKDESLITPTFNSFAIPNKESLTVIYPNGGENIPFGTVYMVGELYFNWRTSKGSTYVPTDKAKAFVINESGDILRDDSLITRSRFSLPDGEYRSYFVDSTNLKVNEKYKIMVCDYIGSTEYCDSSDTYFTLE